jgi:rhodanese-related sulfurtransferase
MKQPPLFCFLSLIALAQGLGAAQIEARPEPIIIDRHELGTIQVGHAYQHEFVLTNSTAKPLQIASVHPLCDCVQVGSWPKTVAPGSQERIPVLIQPQRPGTFDPAVEVDIAGDSRPRLLTLAGWVEDVETAQWKDFLVKAEELPTPTNSAQSPALIDIRSADKFRLGHIPGSLNLPLFTVKTKSFLQSRSVVLLNEGHDDRTLLAEANRLRSLGFSGVRVLQGGLCEWLQHSGPLAGEDIDAIELSTISPEQFLRVHAQPGWLVINVGAPGDSTKWPDKMPIRTVSCDGTQFSENLASAILDGSSVERVLLVNATGTSYEAVKPFVRSTTLPVFFLGGGLIAYEKCAARELAMQNRRPVTLTSQNSAKFGPSSHPVSRSGGCCSGKK